VRAELVVQSLISGDAGCIAILTAGATPLRLYPGRIPQNTLSPMCAYELVSGIEILPITANAGGTLIKSRVQVTVLAKTFFEVKTLHEAIRKAVLFKSGSFAFTAPAPVVTVRVVGITRDLIGPDTRDDDLGLYIQNVDYMLIHDEV
jgi:hypothetical protein